MSLSSVFPLLSDDRERPFGWSWQRDAPTFDLPGLAVPEALTMVLVKQFLKNYLPPAVLDHMEPYFKSAEKTLNGLSNDVDTPIAKNWPNKVRSLTPTQPLIPPTIDPAVQTSVYEALAHERQLQIDYRRRGDTKATSYVINPLGLIHRGPVLYIACTYLGYSDIRLIVLHRIMRATNTETKAVQPEGFNLDQLIEEGLGGFGKQGEKIKVSLLFNKEAGEHLYETPLSKDQKISVTENDKLLVTATVNDSKAFRWWVNGFGDAVRLL